MHLILSSGKGLNLKLFRIPLEAPMPAIFVFLISFLLVACSENQTPEESIPEVFVIEVTEQPYQPSRGFNGRIRSSSDVDIKAQITGELTAIHFSLVSKICGLKVA